MNFKMFNNFKTLLLAGAMLVGVVSCTDYDDDITSLNDRIDSLTESTVTIDDLATQLAAIEATIPDVTELTSNVSSLLEEVERIDVLESSVSTLQGTVSGLQSLEESLKSYTDGEITSLEGTLSTMYATISALNEVSTALGTVSAYVDGIKGYDFSTMSSDISGLLTDVSTLKTSSASWLTEGDLSTYLTNNNYLTTTALEGYNYITISALATYLEESDLVTLGYITQTQIETLIGTYSYATAQSVTDLAGILTTDYKTSTETESYVTGLINGLYTNAEVEFKLDSLNTALEAYSDAAITSLLAATQTSTDGTYTTTLSSIADLAQTVASYSSTISGLDTDLTALTSRVTTLENMVQSLVYVPATVMDMDEVKMTGAIYNITWANGNETFLPAQTKAYVNLKFRVTPSTIATDLANMTDEDRAVALKVIDEEIKTTRAAAGSDVFSIVGYTLVDGDEGSFSVKVQIDEDKALNYLGGNNTYAIALSITAASSDYLTDFIALEINETAISASSISYELTASSVAGATTGVDANSALTESYEMKYTSTETLKFFLPDNYDFMYSGALLSKLVDYDGLLSLAYATSGSNSSANGELSSYSFGSNSLSMSIKDNANTDLIDDIAKTKTISFKLTDGTNSVVAGTGVADVTILPDGSEFTLEDIGVGSDNGGTDNSTAIDSRIVKWTYATSSNTYTRVVEIFEGKNAFVDPLTMTPEVFNSIFSSSYTYTAATYELKNAAGTVVKSGDLSTGTDGIAFTVEAPVALDGDPKSVTVEFEAAELPESGTYSLTAVYTMADKTTITLEIPQIVIVGKPVIDLSATYTNKYDLSSANTSAAPTFTFGSVTASTYVTALVNSFSDTENQFDAGEFATYFGSILATTTSDLTRSVALSNLPALGASKTYTNNYSYKDNDGTVIAKVTVEYTVTNDLAGELTPSVYIGEDNGTYYSVSNVAALTTPYSMADLFTVANENPAASMSIEYKIASTVDYTLLDSYYISKTRPDIAYSSATTSYALTWNDWFESKLPVVATLVWNGVEVDSFDFEVRSAITGAALTDPVDGAAWSDLSYEILASDVNTHSIVYNVVDLANTYSFVTDGVDVTSLGARFISSFTMGTMKAVYTDSGLTVSDADMALLFDLTTPNTIVYKNNPNAVTVLKGITFTIPVTYKYNMFGGLTGYDKTVEDTITVTFKEI